ncbi:MAG TPA: carbamoyltransferase HypF [Terriglobales bacterium]|nr:carbamoyltransferase HypF [Terriglobales bacterium]
MASAYSIDVRGVVQGVGFRPFVYRLAGLHSLYGWVLNNSQGVEIHVEGEEEHLRNFVRDLEAEPPAAAYIAQLHVHPSIPRGFQDFVIRESTPGEHRTTRVSPDLPVCADCLAEMSDPANRRFQYPYINCTNCGPRYTVILGLPYDRPNTTMKAWPLDPPCDAEYHNPDDRRFHAQPIACPACGPSFYLQSGSDTRKEDAIGEAARLLREGKILAVKGLGGYHLACDARNAAAVAALRARKFRKEKPFALMAADLATAQALVALSPDAETLLTSIARPIVLAPAKQELPEVAPGNHELGVMLPYTPLQHLLFAAGAPDPLVMTSANRSNEPIAYQDDDALKELSQIADAFLVGERPIARRVDDSVVRAGTFGPAILRRARGYAPGAVASLPAQQPILALGADLKNTITLVVDGQAFVSQHIGDLEHYPSYRAFEETVRDLTSMYEVKWDDLVIVHDCHPQYVSTSLSYKLEGASHNTVQHHRAHVASVLAERQAWDERVLALSLDGTGYGDDGSIWGGEVFLGSLRHGFSRMAHLRTASLPGGDAAAQFPVQAAAGFLAQVDNLPDMRKPPFEFPDRYQQAEELVRKHVRTFATSSMGRLFDTAAALLGFTREITFEGQAAMWLEQQARTSKPVRGYPFPFQGQELDFRPLLRSLVEDRLSGRDIPEIARAFQLGLAEGFANAIGILSRVNQIPTVVLSGGVFQNEMLLADLKGLLSNEKSPALPQNARPGHSTLEVWTNHAVPANDGGISLGQAALAAFAQFNEPF